MHYLILYDLLVMYAILIPMMFYCLLYVVLPRQNKMSENIDESEVEMVISIVLKLVCFGHFILFW